MSAHTQSPTASGPASGFSTASWSWFASAKRLWCCESIVSCPISRTNHVLPTSGFAKFYSSLSVDDFLKKYTFQYVTKEGLKTYRGTVSTLARSEGLFAHEKAVKVRFEDEK